MKAPIRPEQASEHIDDRLLFLVRAHARLILVEADEIDSRRGPRGIGRAHLRLPALAVGGAMGAHSPAPP